MIVAALASRLRDASDMETVRASLADAVVGAVQPTHLSVWIKNS